MEEKGVLEVMVMDLQSPDLLNTYVNSGKGKTWPVSQTWSKDALKDNWNDVNAQILLYRVEAVISSKTLNACQI